MDVDARFVEVQVSFPNTFDPTIYSRTFDLYGLTAPFTLDVSIDHSPLRVELSGFSEVINPDQSGDTYCDLEGVPFVFTAQLIALDGVIGDPGTTQTVIAETIILPTYTPLNGDEWAFISDVPSNTQFVIMDIDSSAFYDPDDVEAFYGLSWAYTGGANQTTGIFVDATCLPMN